MAGSYYTSLVFAAMVALQLGSYMMMANAAQYDVGGTDGWSVHGNYTAWAEKYTYKTGDSLFFRYAATQHSVLQVTKANYASCTTNSSSNLFSDDKGNTTVPLTIAGKYWFICGVSGHCDAGMKFAITVLAEGSSAGAPAPAPTGNSVSASSIISYRPLQLVLLLVAPLCLLFKF